MGYDPRTAGKLAFNARRAARPSAPAAIVDDATTLTAQSAKAAPCAILLRSLVEDGPVPDDFRALVDKRAVQQYVRPDGAVFRGAFEFDGLPDSLVLVWADHTLTRTRIEQIAQLERPALMARHKAWRLGPFAMRSFVEPLDPSCKDSN